MTRATVGTPTRGSRPSRAPRITGSSGDDIADRLNSLKALPTTATTELPGAVRAPRWSGALTERLGRVIPVAARPAALSAIKAIHTVIFASVGAAIALFVWDGLRQRPGRRAALALGLALGETAVYVSNNQVCPLTPLAEELGAERGSVADIFLPDWFSRRIPLFGGSALIVGLVLHVRAALRRRG
jgi:hypothetical protein